MSIHEQQTSTIPTSVVRNTRGKSGPQNLEEPASNEALIELCDKNYHQLLPLIAEKCKKKRSSKISSKRVFRRLNQNRSPSPRLRPRKEGGVFNRLGRKEPGVYTRSDSHHQSSQVRGTEIPARKHHHEGTSSRRTRGYSESEESERGHCPTI
ncbi:hypothetical protein Tco_0703236 [Tanacetum coccineum]|uniref:Reverse transcriptase domain-containing protein n=1 Tax=Tanacetum coccineum TaxID=301880 RepID=A0ABQ4XY98_9ASTR